MCLTIIFFIASLSQKFQHFRYKILALVRQKINLDRNIINVFAQFGREIRVVENPHGVFFSGEDVFLDDLTVADVEKALQTKLRIVESDGCDFVRAVSGR